MTSGVEGDEEIPGRIDAEQDGREESEWIAVERRCTAGRRHDLERRRGTVEIPDASVQWNELPSKTDPLEERVLVGEPEATRLRARNVDQLAPGTGESLRDETQERFDTRLCLAFSLPDHM
ncbi:MAG: hypothetical protein IPP07_21425 [Holophagales bacterium]|nr:hypothetical protein [Holophagales bacterium]